MPFYHSLGSLPRKRHIAFRSPEGTLYPEELMGTHGFSGSSSLLYHVHPPTVVRATREVMRIPKAAADSRELRHRHFRTAQAPVGGSPTLHRTLLLFNDEVSMAIVHADHVDKHFFRNAQADEILYVTRGSGTLETPFGRLAFTDGDYLVIPRGIIYRLVFDPAAGPLTLLVIESRGMVRTPRRYRTEFGQMKEGAPFSERDLRRPQFVEPRDETGEFPVLVKQYDALTEREKIFVQQLLPATRRESQVTVAGFARDQAGYREAIMNTLDTELEYLRLRADRIKAQAELLYLTGEPQS